MFPKHINPEPYYHMIAEFLCGYDLANLNYVNSELNDFCSDKIYKKLKEVDDDDLQKYYRKNDFKPFNAIISNKPICSNRYLGTLWGEIKSLNDKNDCYGSIFVDPNDGQKRCESCMTKEYGEEWKDWSKTPKVVNNIHFYVEITEMEVVQEFIRYGSDMEWDVDKYLLCNQREEYKRQRFCDSGERDIGINIKFNCGCESGLGTVGEISINFDDYRTTLSEWDDENKSGTYGAKIVMGLYEYDYEDTIIYI